MTTRTFTITLDEADRLAVLTALGFAEHITPVRMRRPIMELIERLSAANGQDSPENLRTPSDSALVPVSGTEAARAVLSPPAPSWPKPAGSAARRISDPRNAEPAQPAPTDYFQRDKKGNVLMAAPDGAELSRVKIVSAQKFAKTGKAPYLKVIFAAGVTLDNRTRPAGQANCFDQDLWPPIKNRENQVAALWIQESGNYLNVVGIRA